MSIDPAIWDHCEKIGDLENAKLCEPFIEEEIREALFQMEKNKAPGPDKIPIEFYQTCWNIVKKDIIELFNAFHANTADISRLNYGIITLIPKVKDASKIQQFRPRREDVEGVFQSSGIDTDVNEIYRSNHRPRESEEGGNHPL